MTLVLVVLGVVSGWWATARLRTLPAPGGRAHGLTSVVVPARNEADRLPGLLRSLHPWPADVEVIVVDDGSTDATAAVARQHGATVVAAPPAPPGWLGKPWACWVGAEAARGARLVFLDADTELGPDALARLAAVHEASVP